MTGASTGDSPGRILRRMPGRRFGLILGLIVLGLSMARSPVVPAGQETAAAQPVAANILQLLGVTVSPESQDYVAAKTQFQLHTLLTEQRHPRTMNLSRVVRTDAAAGLRMLLGVDEDVVQALERLAAEPRVLEELSAQISAALLEKGKIYFYGCGATGRLAKQMESSFWRPFWRRLKADNRRIWDKLRGPLGPEIEDRLIGEMTGGDRALISSLEGFEDLQLIGRLQLEDRKVRRGDVIIAVTEGGETSSVIGTILGGLEQWKTAEPYDPRESRARLYFVYNNPDDRLLPFDRSRAVLREPGITKINLTTGPQAITGSTRMQATTIETFVLGHVLQDALARVLGRYLSKKEMASLGFGTGRRLADRLKDFAGILRSVKEAVPDLAPITELEARTYAQNHFSTYFAESGAITVFIDSTERSPTFRLYPLDTVNEPKRRCWIQVWIPAGPGPEDAWKAFLGRPFRGLDAAFYEKPFEEEITDPYLRTAALESLKKAGSDQQRLYDFSASNNSIKRGPQPGDMGLTVIMAGDADELEGRGSPFNALFKLSFAKKAPTVCILIWGNTQKEAAQSQNSFIRSFGQVRPISPLVVSLKVPDEGDAFDLNQHIALKILLNAHSTAVMARLGRVVGNTMTNVSPSNLKLIGRATFLIQSHVNDALARPQWVRRYGLRRPVTYGEANAVLFDSIAFLKDKAREAGQTPEVALSIIRVLESLKQNRGVSPDEALGLVRSPGLEAYLQGI